MAPRSTNYFPNDEPDGEYDEPDDDDTVNDKPAEVDIHPDNDEDNTNDTQIVLVDDDEPPPIDDPIQITPDLPPPPPAPATVNQGAPADVPESPIEEEMIIKEETQGMQADEQIHVNQGAQADVPAPILQEEVQEN